MTEKSNTPALDRAIEAGYCRTDTDECCSVCRYSYIQEYSPSGTKFLCGRLNIQTHEDYRCNHFERFVKAGSGQSCGTTKLKPYPFCNSDLSVMGQRVWHPSYNDRVDCILRSFSFRDEEVFRRLWNRRVKE